MDLIKQLVALNEEAKGEDQVFFVNVRANVWAGKYHDYRVAQPKVLAATAEEAIDICVKYPEVVMKYIHDMKVRSGDGSRYLIPHKDHPSKNVFIDGDKHKPTSAKKLVVTGPAVRVINRQGEIVKIPTKDGFPV